VPKSWELTLVNPVDTVSVFLRANWAKTLADLKVWMSKSLIHAMIYGDFGIRGISDTPFFNFISSPEGLSELGIEKSQPRRLLAAYEKAFKISTNNNTLLLQFGDVATLKMLTPHPASGTGNLHIQSWLEWIVDDLKVPDRGFVPRSKLRRGMKKNIRIRSAPGGLMLPQGSFGSSGEWEFPVEFQNYEVQWLEQNIQAIESAIQEQLILSLNKNLNS